MLWADNWNSLIIDMVQAFRGVCKKFLLCCCSVAQLCPIFCDPMDSSIQASLSFTISWSSLRLMSIELVIPSNHLILCCPLLLLPSILPSIRVYPMSQFFASGGQSIGASASASVLPMNTQGWFPLGLIDLISLQSKGLSRVLSSIFFTIYFTLFSTYFMLIYLLQFIQ